MVSREIIPDIVYEDEKILAFRDINPQAPVHILVIPKVHLATLNNLEEVELAGLLLQTISKIAKQEGIAESGYRTIINCNSDGGQEVYHLHLHLLGGKKITSPLA
jgi:histidine triad (HIT) family protein